MSIVHQSDHSGDRRPGRGARSRAAAGHGGQRPGAEGSRQRSGADRDRRSVDRRALGSPAAGRPDPAACGLADARRHPARGGRAGRRARPASAPADTVSAGFGTLAHPWRSGEACVANPPVTAAVVRQAADAAGARRRSRRRRRPRRPSRPAWRRCLPISVSSRRSGGLPPQLQQAVAQVLAQRTSLDQNLTGGDIKQAFQSSGLFLEASLASGSASTASGVPDLKAALIVLRQTLRPRSARDHGRASASRLGAAAALLAAAGSRASVIAGYRLASNEVRHAACRGVLAADACAIAVSPALAAPELRFCRRSPSSRHCCDTGAAGDGRRGAQSAAGGAARSAGNFTAAKLRQVASAGDWHHACSDTGAPTTTYRPHQHPAAAVSRRVAFGAAGCLRRRSHPIRRSATARSICLTTPTRAIARQTLLQVASLPDRVDATASRLDAATPRWNFEIPFATPQGTAMAQFEISRDGGGSEVEAAKRVWRARFSLDVEPAGPGACAGVAERRAHVGADVGGAAGDRRRNCAPASRNSARR